MDTTEAGQTSMAESEARTGGLSQVLRKYGQIVLVLQGGGALGAYQAGVYEALHSAGIEPDWVIGTSIGAVHAGIIAGNAPGHRLAKVRDFCSALPTIPIPWLGYRGFGKASRISSR